MKNFLLRFNKAVRKGIKKTKIKLHSKCGKWKGYRPINLFGRELKLSLDSQMFGHLNLKMPVGLSKSDIVQYADYVQFRSIVQCMDDLSVEKKPVFVDVGAYHGLYVVMIGSILKEKGGVSLRLSPIKKTFQF
ncbi:MAG: hypothetical protein ACD_44C00478G0001 [uncultured bacterium]|nr:MAG: hypothetical protein ACD_44C00478G0001 [uncultured bacterium]